MQAVQADLGVASLTLVADVRKKRKAMTVGGEGRVKRSAAFGGVALHSSGQCHQAPIMMPNGQIIDAVGLLGRFTGLSQARLPFVAAEAQP